MFGDVTFSGAEEVKRNWDDVKREEKRARASRREAGAGEQAAPSVLDGAPFGQPALSLAAQLQRRAARAGVPEDLMRQDEGADADAGEQIGRELFLLVARARKWNAILRWNSGPQHAATANKYTPGNEHLMVTGSESSGLRVGCHAVPPGQPTIWPATTSSLCSGL